jgi:hypothetical protein
MFGFSFEDKVRGVLKRQFNYRTGSFQSEILTSICLNARASKLNEYDAAIMFMMVQMNTISTGNIEAKRFVEKHCENARRCLSAVAGSQADFISMMDEISAKHFDDSELKSQISQLKMLTFKEWMIKFKSRCGELNPSLRVNGDGSSIIDFLDNSPLKRAYIDGVDPFDLATSFASNFDINAINRP